jgi:hypothetical protein
MTTGTPPEPGDVPVPERRDVASEFESHTRPSVAHRIVRAA